MPHRQGKGDFNMMGYIGYIFTLAAVILYYEFHSMGFLRLFFLLFGIALTGVGVVFTLRFSKSKKDKVIGLAIHALLWVFGRVINWIVGPVIALGIIFWFVNRGKGAGRGTETGGEMTLESLPGELYSGSTTYVCKGRYGWGVEYVNSADSGESFTITTIYSASSGQVHTNAGDFWYS